MKAVDSHLLTLLKASSQFIVPIYQRLYSWQEPECAQLWADIVRAGSNPKLGAHFTGSIVYVAREQSTNTSAEPDLIIDGQQRVTTVTLILTALAARLEMLSADEQEPWDGFSPRKIRNRYLLNDDEEGERQYKLILSQSDKAALISILQGVAPSGGMVTRVIDNCSDAVRGFFRRGAGGRESGETPVIQPVVGRHGRTRRSPGPGPPLRQVPRMTTVTTWLWLATRDRDSLHSDWVRQ
ncbi:MAG: DUF262 domain-containing protein [Nocardioides sp.]|nr:DUF262 domain-containing protein [Nocardioides sp.]